MKNLQSISTFQALNENQMKTIKGGNVPAGDTGAGSEQIVGQDGTVGATRHWRSDCSDSEGMHYYGVTYTA